MKQAKPKKRFFVAVLLMVLSSPLGVLGQNGNFTHQSFGNSVEGGFMHQSFGNSVEGGFMHQSFGNSVEGGFAHQTFGNGIGSGFTHQGFGNDIEGGFIHQPFGNDAPLGSGLLILLSAGASYAAWKRKKQQINRKN